MHFDVELNGVSIPDRAGALRDDANHDLWRPAGALTGDRAKPMNMQGTLDTNDVDREATARRVLVSRMLRYLDSLVEDAAKSVVRQVQKSKRRAGWRRLHQKVSLPGATTYPDCHTVD